jgi:hypothetical protein
MATASPAPALAASFSTAAPLVIVLQPVNTIGLFQISVSAANTTFSSPLVSFSLEQPPLAESSFFSVTNPQPTTYFAGAKPQ